MATRCLCTSVRQLSRRMTSIYETHLSPYGVSAPQFSLLQRLHQLGPIANLAFAEAMGMDRSTLSRGLKPLIAEGWIETVDMPESALVDKRSFGLQLTAAGVDKYASCHGAWKKAQMQLHRTLGAELSTLLLDTTQDVYQRLA
ncbi:MarR family winged helix-turn-helix transcriptional regulator [Pseudomonas sp. NPDC090202]|uniref:MarR family winged helix-turn-helix transcriptional regulator n=1 Tax=unclassified Pseudomonas TaxID=196821 RepID=UPI0037F18BA7